jgi:hypothetical protein
MPFPNAPNFNAPEFDSAWWMVRRTVGDRRVAVLCRTEGFTFVRMVQHLLRTAVPGSGWLSYDAARVSGGDVGIDGRWGPISSRALWAYLDRNGAPQVLKDALAYYARRREVAAPILLAMIWALEHQASGLSLNVTNGGDLWVPGPTLFRWETDPPMPPGWTSARGLVCSAAPAGTGPTDWEPAPAPEVVLDIEEPAEVRPTPAPTTRPETRPVPSVDVEVEPMPAPRVARRPSPLAVGAIALLALGATVAGAVALARRGRGRKGTRA